MRRSTRVRSHVPVSASRRPRSDPHARRAPSAPPAPLAPPVSPQPSTSSTTPSTPSTLDGTSLTPLTTLSRHLLTVALSDPAGLDLPRLARARAFSETEAQDLLSTLHDRVVEAASRFDPTHQRCTPGHCTQDVYRCFLLYARRLLGQSLAREIRALAVHRALHVSLDDDHSSPSRDLHQRTDGRFELTRRRPDD